jgi:hypothetical protein
MLQRVQTVYLFVIAALMVAVVFFPLATLQSGDTLYSLDVFGVSTTSATPDIVYSLWGLFVLAAIIALLSTFTIFLYKKRILQIRICIFNAIVLIGFYAYFAFSFYLLKQQEWGGDPLSLHVKIPLSFPFISLVLDYLAIRNIGADEVMIRSLERLR